MDSKQLSSYDHILVGNSGGKDSQASTLVVKEMLPPEQHYKIELWHHLVDGRGGLPFMDWPCTEDYCRQFAEAVELPIYMSWLDGGFKREMLRENTKKAATYWENPDGTVSHAGGIRGKESTRLMFPAKTAALSSRWCSAYLKIDVMSMAINNQPRFKGKRILVVTGERAEESAARAKYLTFEDHRTNSNQKTVHHWRPVHAWEEGQIWDIIKKYNINPHPAYKLGWSRLSCLACIFGNPDQWASVREVSPEQFNAIKEYEEKFNHTIDAKKSVVEMADYGIIYSTRYRTGWTMQMQARGEKPLDPIVMTPDTWRMPEGAYGRSCGPT